jgi:RNA polymerase sigma factor (sigma-70 family)
MDVTPTQDLAGLLAEDRWMRQLARRLAADPHAAEDLAQDAWVAALSGGGGARRRRAWLGGVVRNLWRDLVHLRGQRARREERAARGERLPSSGELVEELELRKHIANALCELEEPYRRTLTLRFFHDRSLREIAEAEGLSIAAIHEREQRGLARLRARLARTSRGESESWAVALLALARPRGWIGAGLETIAMASAWKLGTAAAVLVGGGLAWWWHSDARAEKAQVAPVATEPAVEQVELASEPPEPVAAEREMLATNEPVPAVVAPATSDAQRVQGRIVDPSGVPVVGATLAWTNDRETFTTSVAGGSFELAWPGGFKSLAALEDSFVQGVFCADAERITLRLGLVSTSGELLVIVAPRSATGGVVVDELGHPIPGASVAVRVRDRVFRELGVPRPASTPRGGDGRSLQGLSVLCNEFGEFRVDEVPGGPELYLLVVAPGFEGAEFELPSVPDLARVLTLAPGRSVEELFGVVLDPEGTPLEDARVSVGVDLVLTDAEGRFSLPSGAGVHFEAHDGLTSRVEDPRAAEIVAVHPLHQPARLSLADHDPALPLELRLGPPPLAIRGTVLDAEGKPRAGVQVWPSDPSVFGTEVSQVSESASAAFSVTIEEVLSGGFSRRGARTDAEGRFELGGLVPRAYALRLFDPESAERAGPFAVEAGREGVELVLPGAECVRVAGRIVSLSGEPLVGVELRPRSISTGSVYDSPPDAHVEPVTTDGEGRFAFERLFPRETVLQLEHPRLFFRQVALAGFDDLEHLELVEPVLCELQVDLTRDPVLADTLWVLDSSGEPLQLLESFGVGVMTGIEARFARGLSEVLRVPESGVTLVLRKDGFEVLRRPLTLDPEQRTVVRP